MTSTTDTKLQPASLPRPDSVLNGSILLTLVGKDGEFAPEYTASLPSLTHAIPVTERSVVGWAVLARNEAWWHLLEPWEAPEAPHTAEAICQALDVFDAEASAYVDVWRAEHAAHARREQDAAKVRRPFSLPPGKPVAPAGGSLPPRQEEAFRRFTDAHDAAEEAARFDVFAPVQRDPEEDASAGRAVADDEEPVTEDGDCGE